MRWPGGVSILLAWCLALAPGCQPVTIKRVGGGPSAREVARGSVLRGPEAWEPERFDEFLFADDYAVKGLDREFRAEGLGVPLIGLRRFRIEELEGRAGQEKFLMPRQVYAATAFLRAIPS